MFIVFHTPCSCTPFLEVYAPDRFLKVLALFLSVLSIFTHTPFLLFGYVRIRITLTLNPSQRRWITINTEKEVRQKGIRKL